MTKPTLTTEDLQNILACLSLARVEGIAAAAKLVVLHNKVQTILNTPEAPSGSGNSTESDQSSADQPSAADDHGDASH